MSSYISISEISEKFKLKKELLIKFIKAGVLDSRLEKNGEYAIPDYLYPRLKLLAKDKAYQKEILKKEKHWSYEYHPELKEYLCFHDILDDFSWMLKLRFSSRETLKNKKYRIDVLFQDFLKEINFDTDKFKRGLIKENASKKKFKFHLLQGWYNEIATNFPFSQDLDVGSSLSFTEDDFETELFPSWKIIKSYYSIYSFYTALVFTENGSLNTKEHRKSSVYFNRHLLKNYSKFILKFPFNIYYKKRRRNSTFIDSDRKEWKYKYSQCPRGNRTIFEIETEYQNALRKLFSKELNNNDIVTILDVMYKFRIWSNYQGISTIHKLKHGGFLLFLERNLYTINFFIAGITELIAITMFGEEEYKKIFEEFYLEYIKNNSSLYDKWYKIPQIMRYRIYRYTKIIKSSPKDFTPPNKDEMIFNKVGN